MRKAVGILIPTFLLTLQTQGQPLEDHAGFKAGVNLSRFLGDGADLGDFSGNIERVNKLGFSGGFFYSWSLHEIFQIQPELLYTIKGDKADVLSSIGAGSVLQVTMHYLELPVLAKVQFPTDGSIVPNVFAGPYVSLLVNASRSGFDLAVADEDIILGMRYGDNIKDKANPLGSGVVVGGGAQLVGLRTSLGIEARYTLGLVPAFDQEPESFNGVISVLLAFGFSFGS